MIKTKLHLARLYRAKLEEGRKGLLHLDMNEGIPGLPDTFLKKIFSGVDPGSLSTYPEYKLLQKKVAEHSNLKPGNICLTNGSDAAIKYIFDAYVSKGDRVLLTNPTFAMYPVYCQMFEAKPVILDYKNDMSFPVKEFMNVLSRDIRLAVVVNPNNPTGSVLEKGDLIEIIKKAANNDVLIVVDEAYFYFYPHSVIEKVKIYPNLIVLRTFSKLLGMAALRLGYAAASNKIIEYLRKVKPTFDVNGLAVLVGQKLLDNPAVINDLIKDAHEGKQYLAQKLDIEAIEYLRGHANFILIKCGKRVDEIINSLAKDGILVNGRFRQGFLNDYIRVTIGNKAYMQRFWQTFIKIWRR
ncbi:MAG: histidinol-phosphate transaminase [Candidatus Omnitrophica bacterium]|nr:histidinol-phosphate transaminase [Candidatus Omnitrophota bacterium]MDD5591863.1 histidinol-phosphate transaminase [Candidatus Omnitrophota bacterium]